LKGGSSSSGFLIWDPPNKETPPWEIFLRSNWGGYRGPEVLVKWKYRTNIVVEMGCKFKLAAIDIVRRMDVSSKEAVKQTNTRVSTVVQIAVTP